MKQVMQKVRYALLKYPVLRAAPMSPTVTDCGFTLYYEQRTHCIVILRVKLLLENTILGQDQEEK